MNCEFPGVPEVNTQGCVITCPTKPDVEAGESVIESPIESSTKPDVESSETDGEFHVGASASVENVQEFAVAAPADAKARKRKKKVVTTLSSGGVPAPMTEEPAPKRRTKTCGEPAAEVGHGHDIAPTYEDIQILAHQKAHVSALSTVLERNFFAMDLSPMGTGKTYVATHICAARKIPHVVVVAPLSVLPKWNHMAATYGLPLRHAVSYCSLRSVKCKQPKHGLLRRVDKLVEVTDEATGETTRTERVEFYATPEWTRMIDEGVLLVVDEIQNVKNVSSQFLSVKELIRAIVRPESEDGEPLARDPSSNPSRILLLSGTPVDKHDQIVNLYRVVGALTQNLGMYNHARHRVEARGYRELLTFHERLIDSPAEQYGIREFYRFFNQPTIASQHARAWAGRGCTAAHAFYGNTTATQQIAYSALVTYEAHMSMDASRHFRDPLYALFRHVFCKRVASAMPPPRTDCRIWKRNAYYAVPQESRELLMSGVSMLRRTTQFDASTGEVHIAAADRRNTFHGISRALQMIETAKIPMFARIAKETLSNMPHQKVVICVNYTDTIVDLVEELRAFSPLVLQGSTTAVERDRVLRRFQDNSTTHRLLIGNVHCLSTGIDLDDKHGNFPRLALISPNYSIITLHQLCYRFLRTGTCSDSEVHFVFGRVIMPNGAIADGYEELAVLNALATKSTVMREISSAVNADSELSSMDYKYPGEFSAWQDPDLQRDRDP